MNKTTFDTQTSDKELELRRRVFEYAEFFTDMEQPEEGSDGYYIVWQKKFDDLMELIKAYGDSCRVDELHRLAYEPGDDEYSYYLERLAELQSSQKDQL